MYAATSLRDAYRKFRAKDPSYVYAFGQQAFFVFVMGDAIKVHELLPDVMIDDSPGYATIRVHSLGFYQLVYRLVATGQKVATTAEGADPIGAQADTCADGVLGVRRHWRGISELSW